MYKDKTLTISYPFTKYLLGKLKSFVSPHFVLLDHCTGRCIYCSHWKKKEKQVLQIEPLLKFVKWNEERDMVSFTLTGGEPVIYPFLKELLDNTTSYFQLYTSLYYHEKFLKTLLKYDDRIFYYRISMDGVSSVFEYHRRMKWSIFLHNFELLANSVDPRKIVINTVITRVSLSKLEELLEFLEAYGIYNIVVFPVLNNPWLRPSDDEFYKTVSGLIKKFPKFHGLQEILRSQKISMRPEWKCYIPLFHILVWSNGDVAPCCNIALDSLPEIRRKDLVLGNIYRDSPEKIFKRAIEFVENKEYLRAWNDICSQCTYRYVRINKFLNEDFLPTYL